jgi:acetyl-CoA C-acetyltransferase
MMPASGAACGTTSAGCPLTHDAELQALAHIVPIGIAADAIATQRGYTREMLDTYAASSQQRAAAAAARGQAPSLVPVAGPDGQVLLDRDENIRPATTAQTLAGMQPAFAGWGAKGGDAGFDAQLCRRLQLAAIDHVHHAEAHLAEQCDAGDDDPPPGGLGPVLLGNHVAPSNALLGVESCSLPSGYRISDPRPVTGAVYVGRRP